MNFKILHTADVHLGVPLHVLGPEKAEKQREQIKETFAVLVDTAIKEKFAIVLIAGDLFDSNSPAYETVMFVKRQLEKLNNARIHCCILPGTHDCLSKDSIYLKEHFSAGLEYVYVFAEAGVNRVSLSDAGVAIWGKPNTGNKSKDTPIIRVAEEGAPINVLMAHGSYQIEGKSSPDDYPISVEDILRSEMDYIALGHWHGAAEYSRGKTVAWYSGSPELVAPEQKGGAGQGHFIEVKCEDGKVVSAAPIRIGKRFVKTISIDVSGVEDDGEIYREALQHANADCIMHMTLRGAKHRDLYIDVEMIQRVLEESFFAVVVSDASQEADGAPQEYPEQTIISQFIAIAEEKKKAAKNEEEKAIIEKALMTGVALLNKKEIL